MKRLLLALVLLPSLARAQDLKDRFNAKVIFQGLYLNELSDAPDKAHFQASPFSLLYGDFRLVLDGRRLPGKFELHVDARVRITNDLDTDQLTAGAQSVTARGYYGGREYEVREVYARRRGEKFDFAVGRMFVPEGDTLKIDGIRAWYRFAKHWDLSLFAGGYPKPYSRSVTTDYQGSAGYYGPAVAAGADVAYIYDKFWGSVAVAGAYLGGNDDGGTVVIDPTTNTLQPAALRGEGGRGYLHWVGFERFTGWLDFYHDLVFDFYGAAGLQLTRFDLFATARAGKHFTVHAGYDHLTSFAIEMYLNELLTRRDLQGNPLNSITNNLIIERTAREQGWVRLDASWGKFDVYGEGRLRWRSQAQHGADPQFLYPGGTELAPHLAYDATFGARDLGTLKGIRAGLWYTYLNDFRSWSHILGLDLGRSFLDERLTLDLHFLYAKTSDFATGQKDTCLTAQPLATSVVASCYGLRDGNEYELGLTTTALASKHWYLMLDYRFVANQTAGQPMIYTNLVLVRIEARY